VSILDWFSRPARFVEDFSNLGKGLIEIEGEIEALSLLSDPVDGRPCVAIEYSASPPSLINVIAAGPTTAFTVSARQAVDFVITDGKYRVLVRVEDEQDDVIAVHRHLMDEHGLRLRVRRGMLAEGDSVRVRGRVERGADLTSSPYRNADFDGVIVAERFWAAERAKSR
jgi:hypothetical protein